MRYEVISVRSLYSSKYLANLNKIEKEKSITFKAANGTYSNKNK